MKQFVCTQWTFCQWVINHGYIRLKALKVCVEYLIRVYTWHIRCICVANTWSIRRLSSVRRCGGYHVCTAGSCWKWCGDGRICPGYDTFTTTGVNILNMFKSKVPYICALRILPDIGDFATDIGVSLPGSGPHLHGSITGPIRDREPGKCDLGLNVHVKRISAATVRAACWYSFVSPHWNLDIYQQQRT